MRDTLPDDYTYNFESLSGEPSKFKARLVQKSSQPAIYVCAFFNKNQEFSAEAGLFLIFWRFQPQIVLKLFLFPDISKQLITVVARKNKMALRNMCSLLFHSAKKLKLSMQRPRTS